jgi:hypothetical protein
LNATTQTLNRDVIPQLSGNNFSKQVEPFSNVIPDLRKGGVQLYNQVFCDITPLNNGFATCENCTFDNNMSSFVKRTSGNLTECLNMCKENNLCTAYTYDLSAKNGNNCTLYNTFPDTILQYGNYNQQNKYSGYNIQFPYDYNKLSNDQKTTVRRKCGTQYLNNTLVDGKNTNLESCLTFLHDKDANKTEIQADPKCVWNKLNPIGKANTKIINKYSLSDTNQLLAVHDPLLDTYNTKYNNVVDALAENEDVNNQLVNQDGNFPTYNANVQEMAGSLEQQYNSPSTDQTQTNITNIAAKSNEQIGGKEVNTIESFTQGIEHKRYIQFIALLLLIIMLFFLFACWRGSFRKK